MTQQQNNGTLLYIGGLSDEVDESILSAAFTPFGPLLQTVIPRDAKTQQNRGFGFVEYEQAGDATEALINMHASEFFGRTLTVNRAKPNAIRQMHSAISEQQQQSYQSSRDANQSEHNAMQIEQ